MFAAAAAGDTTDEQALRGRLHAFVTSKPGFVLPPYSAKLDDAYDRADWRAFKTALDDVYSNIKSTNDLALIMNWELYRISDGGGFVIAKLYAVDSWNLALSLEKAGQPLAKDMKLKAVANTLYTFAMIAADSPMCKDFSAPSNRMKEMRVLLSDILRFGHSLSVEDKKRVIDFALNQEATIAPLRKNDEALCRGGTAETLALLDRVKDVPKDPGKAYPNLPGTTHIIEVPGEYHPQFVPDEEWKSVRDAMRLFIRMQLQVLLNTEH